ncbi:MAG: hypothetical protein OXR66_07710 [Candidatus Woesearchaeota archaeon]|nr:hypothetical protein [Candidatus Woesearchaeota archaeon]
MDVKTQLEQAATRAQSGEAFIILRRKHEELVYAQEVLMQPAFFDSERLLLVYAGDGPSNALTASLQEDFGGERTTYNGFPALSVPERTTIPSTRAYSPFVVTFHEVSLTAPQQGAKRGKPERAYFQPDDKHQPQCDVGEEFETTTSQTGLKRSFFQAKSHMRRFLPGLKRRVDVAYTHGGEEKVAVAVRTAAPRGMFLGAPAGEYVQGADIGTLYADKGIGVGDPLRFRVRTPGMILELL